VKAAQLVERRAPLELTDLPDPAPGPGEVVIEVEAEGICRTDWHVWNGDWDWVGLVPELPLVMGHELGGTVVAVGSGVSAVRAGDRVTTPFHESCGRCGYCRAGRSNLCDAMEFLGLTHDGGYAQYAAIRNADFNCIALPDSIDALSATAIKDLTGGGADLAIGGLGVALLVEAAVLGLRKGGRLVQVGLTSQAEQGYVRIPLDHIIESEIEIAGSVGNPHVDYPRLLGLVETGILQPARIVGQTLALHDASAVLAAMDAYETLGFSVITRLDS
jgi:D-arabinose 1-dehydrogenase-like Zn-dependent alcohol dehydrogenase